MSKPKLDLLIEAARLLKLALVELVFLGKCRFPNRVYSRQALTEERLRLCWIHKAECASV